MSSSTPSTCTTPNTLLSIQLCNTCIALVGIFIILYNYMLLPNLRKYQGLRYIAYLILSNGFWCTTGIIKNIMTNTTSIIFIISEYIHTYSWLCGIMWGLIIAVHLYLVVNGTENLEKYEIYSLLFGYGLPVISTIFRLNNNDYFYQLPQSTDLIVIFAMFMTIIIYMLMIRKLRRMDNSQESKAIIKGLSIYPLISFLMMTLYIVQLRIQDKIECPTLVLYWIEFIRFLQPLIDIIIFCFNSIFRYELKQHWKIKSSMRTVNSLDISLPLA